MKNILKTIFGASLAIALVVMSLPAFQASASSLPVGASQFFLAGAGVTSSQTTVQLTSLTTPDGRLITMTNFGTVGYGAIDPQTTAKIEDISFTGITQNANGTATLTGVTRGLDFIYPYTSTASLKHQHSGGATFIVTNTAGFYYNEFTMNNNNNLFTWPTASTSPAGKGYVDFVAFNGAAVINADTSNKGVLQVATGLQAASSTALGSSGASLALTSSIATSTYNSATAPLKVVVTQNNGKIDSNFISTSTLGLLSQGSIGSAADGSITLDGTNIYSFAATTSATVYKLSRSINANNLTINSGIILDTNGYQIFTAGTISGAGTFRFNGNAGAQGAGANGGAGGTATGEYFKTTAGANGGGGNGVGGVGSNCGNTAGNSGKVGASNAFAGGAGGTASFVRAWGVLATDVLTGSSATTTTPTGIPTSALPVCIAGGAGGGGGGTSTLGGGGGGASGGLVEIIANTISGTWNVQATGGAGGAAQTGGGNDASAGAGGNGGICAVFYNTSTWSGACTLTPGTGGNTGNAGAQFIASLGSLLR